MAVAVGSTGTPLTIGSRTTSTLTAPSSIADGNVLVAVLHAGDVGTLPGVVVTPPTGWTEITNSPSDDRGDGDNYCISTHVFVKVASGESGNYAFTHGTADTEGFIYRLTGANTTTPISPNATLTESNNSSTGQTTTYLSITTPVDGSLVILASSAWDSPPTTPPTGTTPTFTERLQGSLLYVCDGVLATAGATGSKSHANGNSGASSPWSSITVCVQAAAGGSPTAISGALMTRSKTFPAGVVSNTLGVAGALVTRGKTFPAGTVANTLNLAGALYTRPHTFPAGVVGLGTLGVGGALYTRPHTFPVGTIVTGSEISGALYTRPHTFPAGTLSLSLGLGGTLYTRPHSFPAGAVSLGTLDVGGALYTRPHTFFGGALNGSLGVAGALITRGKTFPAGAITLGVVNIGGALYTRPKTFPSGTVSGGDPPVSGGEEEVGGVYMIRRRRRGPR